MPLFEFQKPFDSTQPAISSAENAVVSKSFKGLIGDLLLTHLTDVRSVEVRTAEVLHDSVQLIAKQEGDPDELHIVAVGEARPNMSCLAITRVSEGAPDMSSFYVQTPTEGVRRFDYEKVPNSEADILGTGDGWDGHRLDIAMGINGQRIGKSELESLEGLLSGINLRSLPQQK